MTAVIIGFVKESDDAAVPGDSLTICVAILDPKPPDIDPTRRIPIEILFSTANTATGMSNINSVAINCRSKADHHQTSNNTYSSKFVKSS